MSTPPHEIPLTLRHRAPLVTVVGDLILDGWWTGRSERMSREAPAPVVDIDERRFAPGGAANTAVNLAALGARVRVVGLVGADGAGDRLLNLLRDSGVDVSGIVRHSQVRTTSKTRIIAGDQVLVRVDQCHRGPVPVDALTALAVAATAATADAEAEVICDYDGGAFSGPVSEALLGRPRRPPLTVVDAHDPLRWAPLRPDIVTPNAGEAARVLGRAFSPGEDRVAVLTADAGTLLERTGAAAVVVTVDRDGTLTLRPGIRAHRTTAKPATEKQASGAGDTFVAALTLARACGFDLEVAADVAQRAADVVVHRFGTSVCSTADLVRELGRPGPAALEEDELLRRLEEHRAEGRRIVLTNGCFDVLHRGHTSYLAEARRLGDVLVVAVNDDESVRRLKGPGRPINPEVDRVGVLAALSCVDYVTVFPTDTPIPLIRRIRPEVYAKGGDYTPDMLEETAAVQEYGGEVRILGYVPEHSTTAVVNRILAQPEGAA